jgi:hypothetical protein
MREWDVNLPSKEATMSDSSRYRRYVVFQVEVGPKGAGVRWHARALGATEGFRVLEARISEEYLVSGKMPLIALVDCTEGRVLAASHAVGDPAPVVKWGRDWACRDDVAHVPTPPRPTAAADAPDEEDADERAERLRQEMVDRVVASFIAGSVDEPVLAALQQDLEETGAAFEFEGESIIALRRDAIAAYLQCADETEVGEELGLEEDEPIDLVQWCEFVTVYVIPRFLEDADVCDAFDRVTLTDSLGRSVCLVKSIRGYSFSGVEVFWQGLRRSWDEFEAEIEEDDDWFTSPADFENLPDTERAAFIRSVLESR